jgi:hypothetical protein
VRLLLALLASLVLLALGCANRVSWAGTPTAPGPWRPALGTPLVLDWIETRRAGFETNPGTDLIELCSERLREAGLFSEVYEPRRAWTAPEGSFHLALRFDESYDNHAGSTGAKLVATLVTGGIPGLFVPFYADDRLVVEGGLRTPGGVHRSYRVESAATIRSFALVGLSGAQRQLRSYVWNDALWSFAAALAKDETIFVASAPGAEPLR